MVVVIGLLELYILLFYFVLFYLLLFKFCIVDDVGKYIRKHNILPGIEARSSACVTINLVCVMMMMMMMMASRNFVWLRDDFICSEHHVKN